jgi:hypothetical protein
MHLHWVPENPRLDEVQPRQTFPRRFYLRSKKVKSAMNKNKINAGTACPDSADGAAPRLSRRNEKKKTGKKYSCFHK